MGGKQKTVIHGGYGDNSICEDNETVENATSAAPFSVMTAGSRLRPIKWPRYTKRCRRRGEVSAAPYRRLHFSKDLTGLQHWSCHHRYDPVSSVLWRRCQRLQPGHAYDPDALDCAGHPEWNLTVERHLGGNWVLELGYVGTKGTRMRAYLDPDQPSLASPSNPVTATCGNAALGVPCLQPGVATGGQVVITQNTASNAGARAQFLGPSR